MSHRRRMPLRAWFALALAALMLAAIGQQRLAAQDAGPNTLQDAWARTERVGRYRFETRMSQTVLPPARITAVGRTARTQTLVARGVSDRAAGVLELAVWDDPSAALQPDRALQVRIEGARAFGRQSSAAEWRPMGDLSTAFAPAGDAAGFLSAAENVAFLGRERRDLPSATGGPVTVEFDRYRFTLNGEAYAEALRRHVQAELERSGDLPAGVKLSSSDAFRRMAAVGEAWVDSAGMPLRLTLDMEFPLRANGERERVNVTTTFLEFTAAHSGSAPGVLADLNQRLATALASADGRRAAMQFGMLLLAMLAAAGLVVWRPKRGHKPALAFLSVQLAFAPLTSTFDLQQWQRFNERMALAMQTDADPAPAADSGGTPVFDTTQPPLGDEARPAKPAAPSSPVDFAPMLDGPDSDEDGLEDSLELTWFTNPANPDSDADGMSDGAEVALCPTRSGWFAAKNQGDPACPDPYYADTDLDGLTDAEEVLYLGTLAQTKDSDGDGITDAAEVKGFLLPGGVIRRWSDPLNPDTDGDGRLDGIECPALRRADITDDYRGSAAGNSPWSSGSQCDDTDADGTPDVLDLDADGDGVPDGLDLSPSRAFGLAAPFNRAQPLSLRIAGVPQNRPLTVDFQIRPTVPEHLAFAHNVLDWPTNDSEGQIQRGRTTTFGDIGGAGDDRSFNGDMRVSPMLEITLPGDTLDLPRAAPSRTLTLHTGGRLMGVLDIQPNGSAITLTASTIAGTLPGVLTIGQGGCQANAPRWTVSDATSGSVYTQIAALADYANGLHVLSLTLGGRSFCTQIPKLVAGTKKLSIVLQEPVQAIGTLQMGQQGAPTFRFDFNAPATYTARVSTGGCAVAGAPVFSLPDVTQAVPIALPVAHLADIVNGAHALRLLQSGETVLCAPLGNLINGSLPTVIDAAKLGGYQISVSENADGTLSAMIPLARAVDDKSGSTEAFSGRMFYQHDTTAPISHTVNLVWLVTIVTDDCPNADCNRADAVLDQPRVVHQYRDESWTVTGLQVSEDLGVEAAVVFEDPAAESDTSDEQASHLVEWDDNLWHLANGLQRIFVEGVDCDAGAGATCASTPNGQRDLRLGDIKARWDSGGAVSQVARWGIAADALKVITASFAHSGEMGSLSSSLIPGLLSQHFGSGIFPFASMLGTSSTQVIPTLLVASEQRYRGVGADAATNVTANVRQVTVDFDPGPATSRIEPVTAATLSWKPFRRGTDGWEPMPLPDYWDRLEKLLPLSPSYTASGDRESEYASAADVRLTQVAYVNLYAGIGKVVETTINGQAQLMSRIELATPTTDNAMEVASSLIKASGETTGGLAREFIKPMYEVLDFEHSVYKRALQTGRQRLVAKLDYTIKGSIGRAVRNAVGSFTGYDRLFDVTKNTSLTGRLRGVGGAVTSSAAKMMVGLAKSLASIDSKNNSTQQVVVNTLQGIAAAQAIGDNAKLVYSFLKLKAAVGGSNIKAFSALADTLKASRSAKVAAAVGLVIEIGFAFGIFAYQMWASGAVAFGLPFNAALSQVVAGAIVAVMLAALASTGVGAIAVGIIGLIDTLITLFCGLFPPDDDNAAATWTCKGLSGLMAEGVAYVIYDATNIIDIDNPNRLRITRFDPRLADASAGFVTGATMQMSLELQNTIETQSSDSPLSFLYGWQFNESNTRGATFTYAVVGAAEKDASKQIHNRVSLGDNPAAWTALGADQYRQTVAVNQTEGPLTFTTSGINTTLGAYLAEGYASPTQECIVVPNLIPPWTPPVIPICYVRSRSASNYLNLNLAFDVFPPTLSGFYSLTPVPGAYSLAWGQTGKVRFPYQKDADGDGLNFAVDPNDSLPDTDGDGMTDLREVQIGANPSLADSDGDGLNDLAEVRFGSDPTLADTDTDGLTDDLEKAGWSIGYNYINGVAGLSWAYSNPRVADADDDNVFDARERALGLSPYAASDPSVVRYGTNLRETDAALLLMRFDEGAGADTFVDSSRPSSPLTGNCAPPACPTSGLTGLAINAARFDGDDVVSLGYRPTVNGLINGFSIAAWVKVDTLVGRRRIISIARTNGVDGFSFGVDNGKLLFTLYGIADFEGTGLSAIPLGEWVHVGVAVQAAGGQTDARFYVNGSLKETVTRNVAGARPSPNDAVLIGAGTPVESMALDEPWIGFIDELVVYARPLDANGMTEALYNSFNLDDATVTAKSPLILESEIESKLLVRNIEGVLQTAAPAFLSGASAPANLLIAPRQTLPLISRTLSFNTTPASGLYELSQSLGGIVDVPAKPEPSQDADLVYRSTAPLAFRGTVADRREVSANPSYALDATDFTLSIWLVPNPFGETWVTRGVLGYRSGEPNGYPSIQQIGTTLRFGYGTGAAWVERDLSDAVPLDGRWHHLVVSFQRNSGGNAIATVYVDNVARGSLNFGASRPGSTHQRFDIGRSSQTARFRFTQFKLICEADGAGDGEYTINYFTPSNGANALYWSGTGSDGANFPIAQGWREFEDAAFVSVCENDADGSDQTTCDGDDERMKRADLLPWMTFSTADMPFLFDVTQRFSTTPTDPNCGFWVGYDDTADLTYRFDNNSVPYLGSLKDVRLYRRALSASDVTNLYQSDTVLARFKLDERPGATLFADDVARAVGVCSGTSCPVTGLPGRDLVAARFDGVNDYISADQVSALAHTVAVSGSRNVSFGAWIKPDLDFDVVDPEQYVLSFNGSNYDNRLLLGVVADGPDRFKVRFYDGTQQVTSPGNYARGEWHHISVLINYIIAGEDKMFVDNDITNIFTTTLLPAADGRFSIGQEWDPGGVPSDFFRGMVDQVGISLSAAKPAYRDYFLVPAGVWHMDDTDTAGQVYGGYDFNGTSTSVGLPPLERSIPQYSSFTIMGWVYPRKTTGNGSPTYRPIIGSHNLDSPWMGLMDGKPALYNRAGDGVVAGRALPPEQWSHVAFQRDDGQLRLYVNGTLIASHNQTTSDFGLVHQFGVAANPGSNTISYFDGMLDEFYMYYQSPLPPDVIRSIHNYQATWSDEVRRTPFIVDRTSPSGRLAQEGQWLPLRAQRLLIDTADAHSRVVSALFMYADSRSLDLGFGFAPACRDADSGAAFCGLFDPKVEGRYGFETAAIDAAGNLGGDASDRFLYVDGSAPALTVEPLPELPFSAARVPDQPARWTVPLRGAVTDPALADGFASSGVATVRVKLFLANGQPAGATPEQIAVIDGGAWSLDYDLLADDPSGRYTGVVLARDQVGNEVELGIPEFTVDNTDPSSLVTTFSAPQSAADPARLAAGDATPQVAQYLDAKSTLTGAAAEQPDTAGRQPNVAGIDRVEVAFEPVFGSAVINRPLPENVVIYLPFDENNTAPGESDTVFRDVVGGRTVTCVQGACPVAAVASRNGQGVYFNGVNARLSRGATVSVTNRISNFTVGAWIKLDRVTGVQHIVGTDRAASAGNGWAFGVADGKLQLEKFGVGVFDSYEAVVKPNVWQHVAAYIRPDHDVSFFINGASLGAFNTPQPGIANTDDGLVIGGVTAASPRPLAGVIDELFVGDGSLGHLLTQLMGDGPTLHVTFDTAPMGRSSRFEEVGGMDVSAGPAFGTGGPRDFSTPGIAGAYGIEFGADRAVAIGAQAGLGVLPAGGYEPWSLAFWLRNAGNTVVDLSNAASDAVPAYRAAFSAVDGALSHQFGGNTYTVPLGALTGWNHFAFVWDGEVLRTYMNGAARQPISSTQPLFVDVMGWLGIHDTGHLAPTAVDDLRVYRRLLSVEEVGVMARTGWRPATVSAAGAGVTATTWTISVPIGLEGFYAVRSRGLDQAGNVNDEPVAAWSGLVDSLAPRLSVYTESFGSTTTYWVRADDFSLDAASLNLPPVCGGASSTPGYYSSPWYLALANQASQLAGPRLSQLLVSCAQSTPLPVTAVFAICDRLGNCAAVNSRGNPVPAPTRLWLPVVVR